MRKRNSFFIVVFLISFGMPSMVQAITLTLEQFLAIVRTYHPIALQASLQVDQAAATVLEARGAFDPTISGDVDQKTFDGKQYYSYFNPQLTVPTWYGLEFKAGVEEVLGTRANPERTPGQNSYVGAKLALNELVLDKRRAALRQAQSLKNQREAERLLVVNDLLFDANVAYLEWLQAYQNYTLFTEIVAINEDRLHFVVTEFLQGSRPAIDTTETLAQLQSMKQQQLAALVNWQNKGLILSTFMWQDGIKPFDWQDDLLPDTSLMSAETRSREAAWLLKLANVNMRKHPKIVALESKQSILATELRLKSQSFIPKLAVSANALSKGYQLPDDFNARFLENNYKLGVDFSMPLLFRSVRGAFRAAQLKIQTNTIEQENTLTALQRKFDAYLNETKNLQEQLTQYTAAFDNYNRLYQGERLRFNIGESTLFLLNSRENKVLEARQKMIELTVKWQKNLAASIWSAAGFVTKQ